MTFLLWTGAHSRSFSDALNWAPSQVPNSTSDCRIMPLLAETITAGTVTINSLNTSIDVTLDIAPAATFTLVGAPDPVSPKGTSFNGGVLNTGAGSHVMIDNSLVNGGAVNQSGDFTLGSSTHVGSAINKAGHTWSMSGAANILAGAAKSHFINKGTLTRSGAGVSDIGVTMLNSGAVNVASGELAFLGATSNNGTMTATGATLSFAKEISGAGTLDIGAAGTLDIVSGSDTGQAVDFVGMGTLDLHAAGSFGGHISAFAAGDLIDLANKIAASETFSSGVLTLFNSAHHAIASLNFNGSYTTASFSLASDGHGGTLVHFV